MIEQVLFLLDKLADDTQLEGLRRDRTTVNALQVVADDERQRRPKTKLRSSARHHPVIRVG
jgi:hypothetical protein